MENAAELLGISERALWHGFLVFLRVGAIVALLPGFGEQSIPVRVKLVIGLMFTLVVAATVPPFLQGDAWSFPAVIQFGVTETIAGFIVGIGLRLFVMALQTAGSMAAQATSLAQIFGGAGVEPLPAIGHVLVVSGLALAMILGMHVRAAALMILSYEMLPPGVFPSPAMVAEWGVDQVSGAFSLAFQLAAPFIIISVLYNLTLGVINRAMPQLMVAFVGAPVITFGGLALLLLLSPLMLEVWIQAMNAFLADPIGVGR
mgnify:CR=1 FL=1